MNELCPSPAIPSPNRVWEGLKALNLSTVGREGNFIRKKKEHTQMRRS
jgi:hypothetical protein